MTELDLYLAAFEHVGPATVTDGTAPRVVACSCSLCVPAKARELLDREIARASLTQPPKGDAP